MLPPPQPKPFSIAIVGGGIGGLCLAVALVHHNVRVHVYEAAPAFSEIGAGVGLGPNARAARPGHLGRLRAVPDDEFRVARGAGKVFQFSLRDGEAEQRRSGRGGAASFDKRLVGIEDEGEEGVVLKFSDGTLAIHDAVVGCDGIKSQVRKLLLGEGNKASEPVFSGHYCYRGLVPADKAIEILGEDLATNSQMYLGNHAHVLTTLIEQGKVVNVVGYRTKEDKRWNDSAWVKPTTKEEMLAEFDGWSKPVKSILGLIEKVDMWALFDHLPVATYHRKGKICLLGDSAHASTPHHGAGAGMAVEDALILSKLLASINSAGELESVFSAYDAVRRPRSQRLVASSRKVGDVYNFEDAAIGDNMEAVREYLQHAWEWIWNENLDRQLENAQLLLKMRLKQLRSPEAHSNGVNGGT
ncbi:hypothetical protein EPUS_04452 [Endocarpon pusillum Z07020]|uniref:FAD-binding domain-containing protein n=1 Tax=Endocarpon pusillum (strain Z07020 / HMAS-L-300199) TaxID=1263415 RepID=U1GG62_ENDPU|nr:uncharacterized protein EPUS_04452 [Endocarpon pusillum Z07020]ERF76632.1 hypothetical protein EPUS_04452 [Endocarpon pusillum Z07020]